MASEIESAIEAAQQTAESHAAIREVISDSFNRLYRQRNIILHGGRLDSIASTAGLRTVAKLAGAGMDRVTHGHYV